MNRRRQDAHARISSVVIFALILAGAIGTVGGVTNVYYKNCQIKTAREIDAIEKRIDRHKLATRTIQMRSDQILNLFSIRTQLKEEGTSLVSIPAGVSEDISPVAPTAVASVQPSL